jgi:hypothetical protein
MSHEKHTVLLGALSLLVPVDLRARSVRFRFHSFPKHRVIHYCAIRYMRTMNLDQSSAKTSA